MLSGSNKPKFRPAPGVVRTIENTLVAFVIVTETLTTSCTHAELAGVYDFWKTPL